MLTPTEAAVNAIRLISGATRPTSRPTNAAVSTANDPGALPMRLVSPAGPPGDGVHLEPAGDPDPDDVVVSRRGATLYLDRGLAARLHDKTLHAQASSDSTGSVVFTLLDQP